MAYLSENALHVYTDGSQLNRPRRQGGVGFVFLDVDTEGNPHTHDFSPLGWKGATNNQMEIQACIEALKIVTGNRCPVSLEGLNKVVIHTDSMYVVNGYRSALFHWSQNGWKTRDGAPAKNTLQWKEFLLLARRLDRDKHMRLEIEWVEGHARDTHNEAADDLAKCSAEMMSERVIRPVRVRRKLSPRKCKPGCVEMRGQIEIIRLITDEYLVPPHDCCSFMYEVMDSDSVDFQLVDKAISEELLSAGHVYEVRFDERAGNPRVVEVLREIAVDADG
jgi:ribonuclease HI